MSLSEILQLDKNIIAHAALERNLVQDIRRQGNTLAPHAENKIQNRFSYEP